jgi:flagellar transcriptional activator FlhC
MEKKSVVTESEQIQLAIQMIKLGARLQLLESQTSLSRERLIKLYKELKVFPHLRACYLFLPIGF